MATLTKRPDIFVSATSGDLTHIREIAKQSLLSIDCHPVEQSNFPPDYRDIERMLREKISDCEAVVHFIGIRYGSEPDPASLPEGTPRRSYTQLEAAIAHELGKKLYVFICPNDFPYGGFAEESDERRALQQEYRRRVAADSQIFTTVSSEQDASLRIRELQTQLEALRRSVSTLQDSVSSSHRSNSRLILVGSLGLIVLLGVSFLILQLVGKSDRQSDDTRRLEGKLDTALGSFSRERELLTRVLDVSLRKNSEFESLTPDEKFDLALREIALSENLPSEQLRSTLDIYAAKIHLLGNQAEALDRVLIAQKDRQFLRAVEIADEGLAKLERTDSDLSRSLASMEAMTDEIRRDKDAIRKQRHELLMAKGRSLSSQNQFDQAADVFAEAENLLVRQIETTEWAVARANRLDSLRQAGENLTPGEGNRRLIEAKQLAEETLGLQSKEKVPRHWAATQGNLGNVLSRLGERLPGKEGLDALDASRQAYENALTVYTTDEHPEDWATIQLNLGNVLNSLGGRLPGKMGISPLNASRQAFEKALTVHTHDQFPEEWAKTQNNLGNVLRDMSGRLPGKEGLKTLDASRQAYGNALAIFTKDRFPEEWATIQNNLGAVLATLGECLSGKEAIEALKASRQVLESALTVRTLDTLPQDWAATQNNLGTVLRSLGVSLTGKEGLDVLNSSRQAFEKSLTVYTEDRLPLAWATSQNNLGVTLFSLGDRLPGKDGVDNLKASRRAYENALTVRTKAQTLLHWATTEDNLGNTLRSLGERLTGKESVEALVAARECYERFLEFETEYHPGKPAVRSHVALAMVAYQLYPRTQDLGDFQQLLRHWEAAKSDAPVEISSLFNTAVLKFKASASYGAFLTGNFALAEQWARESLAFERSLTASANLAHALLFQGRKEEALALYRQYWDDSKIENGKTFRENVLADFAEMTSKQLTHSDLPKIREALDVDEK